MPDQPKNEPGAEIYSELRPAIVSRAEWQKMLTQITTRLASGDLVCEPTVDAHGRLIDVSIVKRKQDPHA